MFKKEISKLTIGFPWNGNPCIDFSAWVALDKSSNATKAWPRMRIFLWATISTILPNWWKTAYRAFFKSVKSLSIWFTKTIIWFQKWMCKKKEKKKLKNYILFKKSKMTHKNLQ